MTPEEIIALILAAEPALLSFAQAIIAAINGSNSTAMNDKAALAVTVQQKALLTSILAVHRDMHAMLSDAMNKNYGITV